MGGHGLRRDDPPPFLLFLGVVGLLVLLWGWFIGGGWGGVLVAVGSAIIAVAGCVFVALSIGWRAGRGLRRGGS